MKQVISLVLWFLLLACASAKPTNFEFVPGKSFGPLRLGQPFKDCVAALPGWTYNKDSFGYVNHPHYVFPKEAKGVFVEFLLSVTPKQNTLRQVEIHDPSSFLKGHPEIRLGCTAQQVVRVLGPVAEDSLDRLDYPHLGIRFFFESGRPPRQEDPYLVRKFKKGQCKTIQIFAPE